MCSAINAEERVYIILSRENVLLRERRNATFLDSNTETRTNKLQVEIEED